ncbi:hypothetical protein LCGC14_1410580 [marine sediment metagenome]|uniref:Uncharacterized protein n=1 Tax=marine sediment metagenome TaxID=412755 RepID=A0A0F9KFE8_9ZZZZ
MFNKIYGDSLRMPREGYAHSLKFRLSSSSCPWCHVPFYLRIRAKTTAIIGAACPSCPWFYTYELRPPLPPAPVQTAFEFTPSG